MRSEWKAWLLGLNSLAEDIYKSEWRISTTLAKHQFSQPQIAFLRSDGFELFFHHIDLALQHYLLRGSNGRFPTIIYHRYGLFGQSQQTLETLGNQMGISRERVRQLQVKALRRLKTKNTFESLILQSAYQTLQIDPPPLANINPKHKSAPLDEKEIETTASAKKAPFFLSSERRNRIPYSETPLSISAFISRLNSMRPEPSKMEKFPYTEVVSWLVENGYLEIVPSLKTGGRTKAPTDHWNLLGATA